MNYKLDKWTKSLYAHTGQLKPKQAAPKRPKLTKREMYQQAIALAMMLGDRLNADTFIDELDAVDPDGEWDVDFYTMLEQGFFQEKIVITPKALAKLAEEPKPRKKKNETSR